MTTTTNTPEIKLEDRNVVDYYKTWTEEQIKADLDVRSSPMVSICMNLTSDFNKGSVLRAHNAFLGKEMWLVGSKRWNRRGSVGTHHYSTLKHSETWEPLFADLKADGYTIVAVDNSEGAENVYDYTMPEKTAFVFGEEGLGLSEEVIAACDDFVYIPQWGSVRSLNIAQAAAVMFSEYRRSHRNI